MLHTNIVEESTPTENQHHSQSFVNQQTGNAENDQNNTPFYETKAIKGTPFTAINDEGKWKAVIGLHVVTMDFPTEEKLIKYLNTKPWEVIMTLFIAMTDIDKKRQKELTQVQEEIAKQERLK